MKQRKEEEKGGRNVDMDMKFSMIVKIGGGKKNPDLTLL